MPARPPVIVEARRVLSVGPNGPVRAYHRGGGRSYWRHTPGVGWFAIAAHPRHGSVVLVPPAQVPEAVLDAWAGS